MDGENGELLNSSKTGREMEKESEKKSGPSNYIEEEREILELRDGKFDGFEPYHIFSVISGLESHISLGMQICIDVLLFSLLFVPVRMVLSLFAFAQSKFVYEDMPVIHRKDLARGILIFVVVGCTSGSRLFWYFVHSFVEKEAVLKLSFLLGVLHLGNRVLSSFGSVRSPPLQKIDFLYPKKKQKIKPLIWLSLNKNSKRNFASHTLLGFGYIFVHSVVLLFMFAVTEVAASGKLQRLLGVVLIVQFQEFRRGVQSIKDDDKLLAGVEQDVMERTQIFVLIILFFGYYVNTDKDPDYTMLGNIVVLYLSEVVLDNLKHLSVCVLSGKDGKIYNELPRRWKLKAVLKARSMLSNKFSIPAGKVFFISEPYVVVAWNTLIQMVRILGFRDVFLKVIVIVPLLFVIKVINENILRKRIEKMTREE